ncbi:FecR family protein [Membranihabitans marinus]|uniref:FecR family protein n=1 Tax=Membranihabitans marinus TaxID=1227546 RepID=UPI001F4150F6|nr:FecR domain-containing protein [Membranihabitans marinus]
MNYRYKFKELLDKYKTGESSKSDYEKMIAIIRDHPSLYKELENSVDKDWLTEFNGVKEIKVKRVPSTTKSMVLALATAAAVALMILAIGWWIKADQVTYIVYQTNYGETQEISLPDGSQLTLNANSTAKWMKDWEKKNRREIKLEGEAYFDIVHLNDETAGQAIPFDVVAEHIRVNVLGTAFNVLSRRGDAKVFLERGKVKLNLDNSENTALILNPGDQVSYDSQTEEIAQTVNETLTSAAGWKNGVISFHGEKLQDILISLSDIFGKEFICEENDLLEKSMDIGVPYMNWEATKRSLELSMNINIEPIDKVYKITSNQ